MENGAAEKDDFYIGEKKEQCGVRGLYLWLKNSLSKASMKGMNNTGNECCKWINL